MATKLRLALLFLWAFVPIERAVTAHAADERPTEWIICKAMNGEVTVVSFYPKEWSSSKRTILVGNDVGAGNQAVVWNDQESTAIIVVEFNERTLPISLTTINKDRTFVRSVHDLNRTFGAPYKKQVTGHCEEFIRRP